MSTYSVIYNTNPYQKAQARTQNQKKARLRAAKKKQALKRQIFGIAFMFLTILATVLVSTSCLKGNQVKASSVHEENVYYKTIQVEEGDTLWTLADQYMGNCSFDRQEYIDEVKEMNHLTSDTIESGAYLMIPYVGTISEL